MRVIVMGTGAFAVPMLHAVIDSPHHVLAVVTQPPRPTRSRRPLPLSPIRAAVEGGEAPVLMFENINTQEAQAALAALAPDVFLVADYGQILKSDTLAIAPQGGVNLHGSLLPKYRGAAPINWAIYHGEQTTGVTVIRMTPACDAGPCLARLETPIDPDEPAPALEERLAVAGAELIRRTLDDLEAGRTRSVEQDASQASRARRLKKSDGALDWSRPAEALRNQIRAMQPWPTSYTYWHRSEMEPQRLIINRAAIDASEPDLPAGTVMAAEGEAIVVATGLGALRLEELQPAGRRSMPAREFLMGRPVRPGDRLGPQV